jgi:hypothetical protein
MDLLKAEGEHTCDAIPFSQSKSTQRKERMFVFR